MARNINFVVLKFNHASQPPRACGVLGPNPRISDSAFLPSSKMLMLPAGEPYFEITQKELRRVTGVEQQGESRIRRVRGSQIGRSRVKYDSRSLWKRKKLLAVKHQGDKVNGKKVSKFN